MSISNKVWAIIGGAAALVIVPAGVAFGVVAAHDEFRPGFTESASVRADQRDGLGMMEGGRFGGAERAGDRDRTQARDGSYCHGDAPDGRARNGANRERGMMGGSGQGMMGSSGQGMMGGTSARNG